MSTQHRSLLHKIVAEAQDLAPSTRNKYMRDLNAWVEFAGAEPSGWTRDRAQEFYQHLITKGRLRPQSANRLMASVIYAAKWWAYRANNPGLDFGRVQQAKKANKIPKRALTDDDVRALLDTCVLTSPPGLRDFALIVLGLETGMRIMSICGTKLEGIVDAPTGADFFTAVKAGAKIKVPYPAIFAPEKGSNEELRAIPLSDTALHALKPWRAWLAQHRRVKGPVFRGLVSTLNGTGVRDTPLSSSMIRRILDERGVAAGIGHVNPHQFRHTFVTSRSATLKPHEISAMTGHTIGLGAMGGYMDLIAIGKAARESTPEWFSEYVKQRIP